MTKKEIEKLEKDDINRFRKDALKVVKK